MVQLLNLILEEKNVSAPSVLAAPVSNSGPTKAKPRILTALYGVSCVVDENTVKRVVVAVND